MIRSFRSKLLEFGISVEIYIYYITMKLIINSNLSMEAINKSFNLKF